MEISNDIIFRSPENGDYILLDCSTSNVTKNGLYQKLPDGRTALKVKINGLDALYVLPIASADTLGGIKVGSGLSIDPTTGILSATGGGTGTVTSVSSGNLTPLFTVSVANPTTTPSFTFTQVAQAANLVFASPNGSSGNPTFRALVAGDIPSLSYVSSVGATLPLTSSGGLTPNISTSMATNKLIGRYSAGSGVMQEVSIGSGLTLTGAGLLNNTATPTPLGYYGAFSDYTNQTASAINTGYPFTFNTTDLTNQVSVVSSSRITIDNTGIYNLQFSAQFVNTDTQEHDVTIWLRKNGTDIAGSSGYVAVVAKHGGIDGHVLPSWNYLLSVVAGDYLEIVWSTTSLNVSVATYAAGSPPPSTASIIATITQQSGIMAGTGITAINSLTGASQTLATGLTGTDFAITSSGSTHTFNLPIASATNTGKLSNTDWSVFNNKQTAYTILTTLGTLSNAVGVLVNNGSGVLSYNNTYIANPMTTLGDVIYGGVSGAATRLAGETGSQKKFLTSQGSGGNPTAPQWSYITAVDIAGIFLYQNLSAAGSTTSYTPNTIGYRETVVTITGLTGTLTINAPTAGALVNGDKLIFRLSDNGTLRTLNFVATTGGYIQKGVAVPISTISINKLSTITFMYNSSSNTWDCVGYVIEY